MEPLTAQHISEDDSTDYRRSARELSAQRRGGPALRSPRTRVDGYSPRDPHGPAAANQAPTAAYALQSKKVSSGTKKTAATKVEPASEINGSCEEDAR